MAGTLAEQALGEPRLLEAWFRVRENRGGPGTDGQTLEQFERGLSRNLSRLRSEVRRGEYRPRPLLRVLMAREGKKPRPLSIPAIRDRILQTAVAMVLQPLFEAEFEDCSFGYRPGRSVNMAIDRVRRYRDEGFRWVVDADISSFFDEIDHGLLLAETARLVRDKDVMELIHLWVRAEVQDEDCRFCLARGVPQGSPIAPLLSNVFLDQLDEALLEEGFRLVRYADDFVILCRSREKAQAALDLTEGVLEDLALEFNERKTRIVNFEQGFRFLGVQFVRSLAIRCRYPETSLLAREEMEGEAPVSPRERGVDVPVTPPPEEAQPTALALAWQRALARRAARPAEAEVPAPATGVEKVSSDQPPPTTSGDPLLRTFYLTEQGSVLAKESERFLVRKEDRVVAQVPAIKVDQILIFGNCHVTTPAMQYCLMESIPIVLLSNTGRYYGVVDSFDTDPVLLHREQFARAADAAFCLGVAKAMVGAKLTNSAVVLRRYARGRNVPALEQAKAAITAIAERVPRAENLDALRGHEGAAARAYFDALVAVLDPQWGFRGRVRQPPTDPVNSLLSFGYTLLFYNVYSLIRARGLNPHVGFLHPLRQGHPALVSDLMEELRAVVVDALVLSLALNGKLSPAEFSYPEGRPGACILSDDARRRFVHAFERKIATRITHPVTSEQLDYRRVVARQAQQLAAVIRGTEERYRPWTAR